jgi:hypothetical protein
MPPVILALSYNNYQNLAPGIQIIIFKGYLLREIIER